MKKKIEKNRYTSQKIKTIINFKNKINENNILDSMLCDNNDIKKIVMNEIKYNDKNIEINLENKYDEIKIDKILKYKNTFIYILKPSFMYLKNIELYIENKDKNKLSNIIKKIYVIIGEKELFEIKFDEIKEEQSNFIIPFFISFYNYNVPINLLQYHRISIKIIYNEIYEEIGNDINFCSNQIFMENNELNIGNYFIKTEINSLKYQTGLKYDLREKFMAIKEENKIYLENSDLIYFTYIYFDNNIININKIKNIMLKINDRIICKYDNIEELNKIKKDKFLREDNVIPFFYNNIYKNNNNKIMEDINNDIEENMYENNNIKNIMIEFNYGIKKMELKDKLNLEKNLETIYTKIFIVNFTMKNLII
jgi:hypothetical protein